MRAIKYTARFKRDYRREKSGILGKKLDKLLMDAVNMLAADQPLPERLRDHALRVRITAIATSGPILC